MKAVKLKDFAAQRFTSLSPASASQKLRRWIYSDRTLMKRLYKTGFKKGTHYISGQQARIIRQWIG